jgi:GDP-L-fucose synthase
METFTFLLFHKTKIKISLCNFTHTMKLNLNDKIYVAGHNGMVGSAIVRTLREKGFTNIITAGRKEVDLCNQQQTQAFFERTKPAIVFLAAAKVGGILANIAAPAEFIYENLVIECNVIHQCQVHQVKKLVFIGSSCMYPRECPQPMKESYILSGKPEPTNEGYAVAKIAGMKMAESYHRQYGMNILSVIPCNLYGINDSFHPEKSHVLSALVRKFAEAKRRNADEVMIWGTGIARRELMHANDLAGALLFLLEHYDSHEVINVGTGSDISIADLALLVKERTGYTGKIAYDTSKPDGMLRKCMDISLLDKTGYKPSIPLEKGVDMLIKEYLDKNP